MEVKLVVASGKHAGKVIPIDGSRLYIGRADDCHLQPRSELVSRHHCVILAEEGVVAVRDFGSKNGTLLNGDRIRGEQALKNGDRLQVGSLELEVQLAVPVSEENESSLPGMPEPTDRTVKSIDADLDLDSWLNDTETLDSTRSAGSLGETVTAATAEGKPELAGEDRKDNEEKTPSDVVGVWDKGKWKPTSANPRDAAADTLKEFFRRR